MIIIVVDRSNHDYACLRSLRKQPANFDISCDAFAWWRSCWFCTSITSMCGCMPVTYKPKVGDVLSSLRLISCDGACASVARLDSECRLPHQCILFAI